MLKPYLTNIRRIRAVKRLLLGNLLFLIIGTLSVFFSGVMLLLVPRLVATMILTLPNMPRETLTVLLIILIISAGLGFAGTYFFGIASANAIITLRSKLYNRFLYASIPYYDEQNSADMVSTLTADSTFIHAILSSLFPTIAQHLPLVVISFGLMLWGNPWLTLMLLLGSLPLAFVSIFLGKKTRHYVLLSQMNVGEIAINAQESLQAIRFIKTLNLEDYFSKRLSQILAKLFALLKIRILLQALFDAIMPFSLLILLLWFLTLVQYQLSTAQTTPEEIVVYIGYVLIAANSTLKLLKAYVQWEQIIGAAERIVKFVEANLQFEKRGNQILSIIQGGIRFEQVSFAYPNTNAGVHQVDLDINPGDFVALTGPNGSGKSTLVHLLLGFYSPDKGKIWLDGYEQSQSDLPSWRNQFAVVTRNPSIFSFSIKENIALGRVGVSFEEVRQAVQKVEMEDFILGLPDGYDTAVGEQGVRLSSGQRQRLALARVYIQDPPVIILDEAITSLDEHAERLLRDTLLSWVGKKTIIFISHNPISKWPINKTIVLKDGYIG